MDEFTAWTTRGPGWTMTPLAPALLNSGNIEEQMTPDKGPQKFRTIVLSRISPQLAAPMTRIDFSMSRFFSGSSDLSAPGIRDMKAFRFVRNVSSSPSTIITAIYVKHIPRVGRQAISLCSVVVWRIFNQLARQS